MRGKWLLTNLYNNTSNGSEPKRWRIRIFQERQCSGIGVYKH